MKCRAGLLRALSFLPLCGSTVRRIERSLALALALMNGTLAQGQVPPARALPQVQTKPTTQSNDTGQTQDVRMLNFDQSIERELRGGAHFYAIDLNADQYLKLIIDQRGIDVIVLVFDPSGKELVSVNQRENYGWEIVSLITKTPGRYRLEVRATEQTGAAGRYQVLFKELRSTNAQDQIRLTAMSLTAEADRLLQLQTVPSVRNALRKYEESLPLWRSLDAKHEEAETLDNIATIYIVLGEREKAAERLKQAQPLYHAVGDNYGEASTLSSPAADFDAGNWQVVIDRLTQALALWRLVGSHLDEATTLQELGVAFDAVGDQRKALSYYEQSLRLYGSSAGETKDVTKGSLFNSMGIVYEKLGEHQRARDFYQQALVLRRTTGDRFGEARTLGNMGMSYLGSDELSKALELFNQMLALARATKARREESNALGYIARAYEKMGENQKALDFLQQSLVLKRAVTDRRAEADMLYGMSRVYRNVGNLAEARTQVEAALTIYDSLRTNLASQELRTAFFSSIQGVYEFYIDLLMRLHRLRPTAGLDALALQASERARARSLLELLAEANADIRQGVDQQLLERERELQRQLNDKAQRQTRVLSGRHTPELADKLAKELDELTNEFQQTETAIRQTSPRYAALTQPQPLNLKEIQDTLDADTLLLEYSLGEERSYLWAVTPTNISSYELPKREMIETLAKHLYQSLNARNEFVKGETKAQQQARITRAEVDYPVATKQLSQMVLAPVATQLGRKRLLIVSDGALQYVPFAALPDPFPMGARRAEPLVVSHELVSLPSASTLAVLRREQKDRKPATKILAVLADPVFARDDERVKIKLNKLSAAGSTEEDRITPAPQASGARTMQVDERPAETSGSRQLVKEQLAKSAQESNATDAELRIARLPGTRREATQIIALIPERQRKLALDFAASRTTALSSDLSDYRYVHFATHGLLNSTHPELSGIVFSLVDEKGQPEDGFLRAHEVFNLKLSADLVVLSACQTGLGKEVRGEGLIGLTRGFMYAGAPRVVVSLWSVDDEATASLMVGFYKAMLSGNLSPAAALRAAQIDIRKQKQRTNPYYWAAFTIQGEWR